MTTLNKTCLLGNPAKKLFIVLADRINTIEIDGVSAKTENCLKKKFVPVLCDSVQKVLHTQE